MHPALRPDDAQEPVEHEEGVGLEVRCDAAASPAAAFVKRLEAFLQAWHMDVIGPADLRGSLYDAGRSLLQSRSENALGASWRMRVQSEQRARIPCLRRAPPQLEAPTRSRTTLAQEPRIADADIGPRNDMLWGDGSSPRERFSQQRYGSARQACPHERLSKTDLALHMPAVAGTEGCRREGAQPAASVYVAVSCEKPDEGVRRSNDAIKRRTQ